MCSDLCLVAGVRINKEDFIAYNIASSRYCKYSIVVIF